MIRWLGLPKILYLRFIPIDMEVLQTLRSSCERFLSLLNTQGAGTLRKVPWAAIPLAGIGCVIGWLFLLHQLIVWGAFGPIPKAEDMRPLPIPLASEVQTIDGKPLGKFYLEERVPASYYSISPVVFDALLATEDVRFYQHHGVDYQSLLRVLVKTLLLDDERSGGGSTLTMQLAKNLYPRQEYAFASLLINKVREMIIAERLEEVYAKPDILMGYLNTVSFGENTFGIETASRRFFSKSAEKLRLEEAATLIGQLKAPTTYNPRLHPEAAYHRRNVVIDQMRRYGYISKTTRDSLQHVPLTLAYRLQSHHDGPAPYFLDHVRKVVSDWAKDHPKPDGSYWDIYRDGLRIVTPLHSRLQGFAQEAVSEQMQRVQKNFERDWRGVNMRRRFGELVLQAVKRLPHYQRLVRAGYATEAIDSILNTPRPTTVFTWEGEQEIEISPIDSALHHALMMQAGFLAIDPNSGQVRAWVGGIDHRYFQYDHVTARRQTGSVFKPIVYAAALAQGMKPCAYVPNDRVVFRDYNGWAPKNSDGSYGGEYSLKGGLTQSVNVVAVNLLMEVGAERVVSLARKLGLRGVPAVPSIALGTAEASLAEMTSAYAAFVNGGMAVQPIAVLRIEDAKGNQLYHGMSADNFSSALSPQTAALLTFMLKNVVVQGTARGLRTRFKLTNDIAGKTGTTQSQTDGWFVGATPDLVAGAWVGANSPKVHFRSMMRGQGAVTALPIWGSFFRRVMQDPEFAAWKESKFTLPSDSLRAQLDCDDLSFPLAMSEFHDWWREQKRQDSLRQVQGGTRD